MPEEAKPQDNIDRILKHLKNGSPAARLVNAHRTADAGNPTEAMKAVLKERLAQVRAEIDKPEA
ncbi:MAG: hypothetical protein ACE5IQ_05610 [Candidatus Methylomirabilales bacterium]